MKAERHFEGEPIAFSDVEEILPAPVTKQDIFDRVVRHYRKQPYRCFDDRTNMCRYRGRDTKVSKCFVGALIDDVDYNPEMEGYLVGDLREFSSLPSWYRENIDFLRDVQRLHDNKSNWDAGMDMILEVFAAERGLRMPA